MTKVLENPNLKVVEKKYPEGRYYSGAFPGGVTACTVVPYEIPKVMLPHRRGSQSLCQTLGIKLALVLGTKVSGLI